MVWLNERGCVLEDCPDNFRGCIYCLACRGVLFDSFYGTIGGSSYAGAQDAPVDELIVEGNVGVGTITPHGAFLVVGHVNASGRHPTLYSCGDRGLRKSATIIPLYLRAALVQSVVYRHSRSSTQKFLSARCRSRH